MRTYHLLNVERTVRVPSHHTSDKFKDSIKRGLQTDLMKKWKDYLEKYPDDTDGLLVLGRHTITDTQFYGRYGETIIEYVMKAPVYLIRRPEDGEIYYNPF